VSIPSARATASISIGPCRSGHVCATVSSSMSVVRESLCARRTRRLEIGLKTIRPVLGGRPPRSTQRSPERPTGRRTLLRWSAACLTDPLRRQGAAGVDDFALIVMASSPVPPRTHRAHAPVRRRSSPCLSTLRHTLMWPNGLRIGKKRAVSAIAPIPSPGQPRRVRELRLVAAPCSC
jgi:hypothetical protein